MYVNMEELLGLLWKGSRVAFANDDEPDSPRNRGETRHRGDDYGGSPEHEAVSPENQRAGRAAPGASRKVPFHVPHTAIFKEGRLESWYFSSKGYLRKKRSNNLNKNALINEFLRVSKPGHYIATLICIQKCDDGFFSTQRIMLHDPAFSKMVKAAFTTHFSGIFQQFVVGQTKELPPWVLNPAPDPRMNGMGVLECMWSPQNNTITLRAEGELSAISHYCLKSKDRDGRQRETSIKMIIHSGPAPADGVPDTHEARMAQRRSGSQTAREVGTRPGGGAGKGSGYPCRARTSGDEVSRVSWGGVGKGGGERGSLTSRDGGGGGRGSFGGPEADSSTLQDKETEAPYIKWQDIGPDKPEQGAEIINARLSAALAKKLEFTQREFLSFFQNKVPNLNNDSFIQMSCASKTGNKHYMRPHSLLPVELPQVGGTDFINFGMGCVISLQERQDVLGACRWIYKLLSLARTPVEGAGPGGEGGKGGERPTLKTILAHFKRSSHGPVQLVWASAIVTVPSELVVVRSFLPSDPQYAGLQQVLQMCMVDAHVFKCFALLDEDIANVQLKTMDSRSMTMDLQEFCFFLKTLRVFPSRITKEEAWQIFQKANKADDGDDDDTELTFLEFKRACRLLAGMLRIDWHAIEAAERFADVLLKPRLFHRFVQGGAGVAAVTGGAPMDKHDSQHKMYLAGWLMLLEAQHLIPSFVAKEDAISTFRLLVHAAAHKKSASSDPSVPSSPLPLTTGFMDEALFQQGILVLARAAGAKLLLPSVTIDSPYMREILAHRCRSAHSDIRSAGHAGTGQGTSIAATPGDGGDGGGGGGGKGKDRETPRGGGGGGKVKDKDKDKETPSKETTSTTLPSIASAAPAPAVAEACGDEEGGGKGRGGKAGQIASRDKQTAKGRAALAKHVAGHGSQRGDGKPVGPVMALSSQPNAGAASLQHALDSLQQEAQAEGKHVAFQKEK